MWLFRFCWCFERFVRKTNSFYVLITFFPFVLHFFNLCSIHHFYFILLFSHLFRHITCNYPFNCVCFALYSYYSFIFIIILIFVLCSLPPFKLNKTGSVFLPKKLMLLRLQLPFTIISYINYHMHSYGVEILVETFDKIWTLETLSLFAWKPFQLRSK